MHCLTRLVVSLMSTVLVVACGDVAGAGGNNDDGNVAVNAGESGSDTQPPRAITASLGLDVSSDCDAATASFEVSATYVDNSAPVPRFSCHVTFDDGATSDACVGAHVFAIPGPHTFTFDIMDLDTGASVHIVRTRDVLAPFTLELALDVPDCGLEVGFTATPSTNSFLHVMMSPFDQVVVPNIQARTGRFQALEPGTYTITAVAEDERPSGPFCDRQVSQTVELRACKDCEH
jgi:hypothetical protein